MPLTPLFYGFDAKGVCDLMHMSSNLNSGFLQMFALLGVKPAEKLFFSSFNIQ